MQAHNKRNADAMQIEYTILEDTIIYDTILEDTTIEDTILKDTIVNPPQKPKPKPKEKPDFIKEIIKVFKKQYLIYRDIEYYDSGKDRSAAGKLLSQYKKKSINKNKNSKQTLDDFEFFFIQCLEIQDNWLFESMSLPIIISQFNKILTKIRGGYDRQKQRTNQAEFDRVLQSIADDPDLK